MKIDHSHPIIVIPVGLATIFLSLYLLNVLVIDPIDKADNAKWAAYDKMINDEKNSILKMDCKQLHDSLLYDKINDSDNQRLASNHYVSGCL